MMTPERMSEIFEKIENVKIAVFGDFCLDVYWALDPVGSEVSVETGLHGQAVKKQTYHPGGAGNVIANLAALKPKKITAVGVVGNDVFGRELIRQLSALGVDTANLITQQTGFDTYAYCKRILEGKELERIDFGFLNRRSAETDEALLEILPQIIEEHDAFIFNQQIPNSIINDFFIEKMNEIFQKFPEKIIIIDSRHFAHRFQNVSLKINETELARMNGAEQDSGQRLSAAHIQKFMKKLFDQFQKPIFVTRGARGLVLFEKDHFAEIPGIQILKKIDPVGAGDTLISALTCSLASGATATEAAELANFAAAVTVQKLYQTGTATPEEIQEIAVAADYVYQPELAEDIRQAHYWENSDIEICCSPELLAQSKIRHAVFDHDGTISALREGWEAIMETMMIKEILGEQYDSADEATYQRVRTRVLNYIEQSTGIQTILQMEALVEIVREFGFVPEDEVKDKFEYKEIYNRALLEMVNDRIARLERGELDVADFTIKGAVDFLRFLREKGVTLYLASGTDKDDVIGEARALGYAELFNGGIYGSLNDVRKYSKKMVIQRILSENHLQGNELAVFGDGPVEMRECRKHNGIAVGVASDEIRRHGLNEKKRARLIKAGAYMIVPDFSQWRRLIDLFW